MRERHEQRVRPFPLRAQPGDHICWAYPTRRGFQTSACGYLTDGLTDKQKVLCILPAEDLDPTLAAIEDLSPKLKAARVDGSLTYEPFDEAYLSPQGFDIDERIAGWVDAIDRAIFDGYSGLRVLADATPILLDPIAAELWPVYELRADILSVTAPFVAMCAYDSRKVDPHPLSVVQALHPTLVGAATPDQFHLHGGMDGGLCMGGELDELWAPLLSSVGGTIGPDVPSPTIDARGLNFIDIAGIRALARTVDAMGERHPFISIHTSRGSIERLWTLLDCDNSIDTEVVFT
ncbi:MAG: MEDS domain-containing protein [Actinomycetota bacterium]